VLDRLTVDDFAAAVGDTVVLEDGAGLALELELVSAATHPAGAPAADADGRRTPFNLLFRGPADPVLGQRIYHVQVARIGALDLFLVPVGRDDDGTRYEAIFG
jgi:hypothetical protein